MPYVAKPISFLFHSFWNLADSFPLPFSLGSAFDIAKTVTSAATGSWDLRAWRIHSCTRIRHNPALCANNFPFQLFIKAPPLRVTAVCTFWLTHIHAHTLPLSLFRIVASTCNGRLFGQGGTLDTLQLTVEVARVSRYIDHAATSYYYWK